MMPSPRVHCLSAGPGAQYYNWRCNVAAHESAGCVSPHSLMHTGAVPTRAADEPRWFVVSGNRPGLKPRSGGVESDFGCPRWLEA